MTRAASQSRLNGLSWTMPSRFPAFLVILIAALALSAQRVVSQKTFVVIDDSDFYSEKTGITKLVKAVKLCENVGFIAEQNEQKRKEIYERAYKNRKKEIIDPILSEISQTLENIGDENDLIVLKVEEIAESGQLLAFDPNFDITRQFISFFNLVSEG